MEFAVGHTFDSHEAFIASKTRYEESSNTLLTISRSDLMSKSDQLSELFKYRRFNLSCKAGQERKCQSKGMRTSSTSKRNCPFEVKIVLCSGKYIIKKSHAVHENHAVDKKTYEHYPENMRLRPNEVTLIEDMIKCNANKQMVKLKLMEQRNGRPVSLKSIHNIQTKVHTEIQQLVAEETELEKLLEKMQQIPNARTKVMINDSNELTGIYFQDDRMAKLFAAYPEVLLIDATYKLNNRSVPLFVLLIIDGNGESEIGCLWFVKSESIESIAPLVDTFKELNENWTQTKVIISDKDFSERTVFQEKFLGVPLQICLFHALRNFNREITTSKRDITKIQREQVLNILCKMAYSRTATEYDELYSELQKLDLKLVMEYFNQNWHGIRDEWTMHGKNEYNNYMNYTTNRVESLNQKLKMIGNHYASLLKFFDNLIQSCTVISSEKDIKAIRQSMKVVRVRFDDPVLKQYNDFLTPYVFEKVSYEYERINKVSFNVYNDENATVLYGDYQEVFIEAEMCTCTFFKTMQLPCRHVFKFRQKREMDLFAPDICASRWTRRYYSDNHPALNSTELLHSHPINVTKTKVPDEMSKFKRTAKVTKQINSLMSTLSTGQFTHFMDKLSNFRQEIAIDDSPQGVVNESVDTVEEFPIDLSSNTRIVNNSETNNSIDGPLNSQDGAVPNSSNQIQPEPSDSFNLAEIRKISLPSKHIRIGRPKGSGLTVVGTKKKKKSAETSTPKQCDRITRSSKQKLKNVEQTTSQRKRAKRV